MTRWRVTSPSPGSWLGGSGRPGEATVPTGAALTTTTRRTPVACIAWTMARVPREAIPASALDRGPRPDSTASAPATAGTSSSGPAAARSAVTARGREDGGLHPPLPGTLSLQTRKYGDHTI